MAAQEWREEVCGEARHTAMQFRDFQAVDPCGCPSLMRYVEHKAPLYKLGVDDTLCVCFTSADKGQHCPDFWTWCQYWSFLLLRGHQGLPTLGLAASHSSRDWRPSTSRIWNRTRMR